MYSPIRQQLQEKLFKKAKDTLSKQMSHDKLKQTNTWEIDGKNDIEKLQKFINLSLLHTQTIFESVKSNHLVELFMNDDPFCDYNRQYQMLYYGDLSIRGEEKRHPLNPGIDIVYKGFDFHNCFNYLYTKLSSEEQYPLRKFDMCTMWDLIRSPLSVPHLQEQAQEHNDQNTFFYRDIMKAKAIRVLKQAFTIFDEYLDKSEFSIREEKAYFAIIRYILKEVLNIYENEKNVYAVVELIDKFNKGGHNIRKDLLDIKEDIHWVQKLDELMQSDLKEMESKKHNILLHKMKKLKLLIYND